MKNKIKAIIVDDEQSARDNLRYLVEKHCTTIEIVAEADKVESAVAKIKQFTPNLVFLDIEMPKENGFALTRYFDTLNFHIVFVTAYSDYAVKAFEVSAVDYLLKPVDIERLKKAESKVLKRTTLNKNLNVLQENLQATELKNIAIPYKNDFTIIKIENIICIKASRVYSDITTFNRDKSVLKTYTYAKKLAYFEESLPKDNFFRVHRSWIININFIKSYSKKESIIILENNLKIPVSKTYKEVFENLFM